MRFRADDSWEALEAGEQLGSKNGNRCPIQTDGKMQIGTTVKTSMANLVFQGSVNTTVAEHREERAIHAAS